MRYELSVWEDEQLVGSVVAGHGGVVIYPGGTAINIDTVKRLARAAELLEKLVEEDDDPNPL